ncbi:lipocalin-like domain-containing protein [Kribbella sp. NPDC049227]|uniref:lipocalin-like domain-containing protein n=1 Tax=Kribbella sp. NPDC049227 TaxID=3364113 RepID=UPI00371AB5FD
MSTLARALAGSWSLVSYLTCGDDGTIDYPLGKDAVGLLVYSPDAHMSGHLMRSGREPFRTQRTQPVARSGTDAEIRRAFDDIFGYGGSYTVDEERSEVHHHLQVCVIPGWEGRTLSRFVDLSDDGAALTLTTGPRVTGGVRQRAELRWRRPARGNRG